MVKMIEHSIGVDVSKSHLLAAVCGGRAKTDAINARGLARIGT